MSPRRLSLQHQVARLLPAVEMNLNTARSDRSARALARIDSVRGRMQIPRGVTRFNKAVVNPLQDPRLLHRVEVQGGVLAADALSLLRSFFDDRR